MEPSTFRWTLSNQKALVGFFRNHESMYNPRHVDFRNTRVRDKLLKQLKETIGCTPCEAKSKFHSLRTYFTKELKKVRHSRLPGNGPAYHSKWELFHDMLFVKDVYQPRLAISSITLDNTTVDADAAQTDANAISSDVEAVFNNPELEMTDADVETGPSIELAPEEAENGDTRIEIQKPQTSKVMRQRKDIECWSNGCDDPSAGDRGITSAPREGSDKDKDEDFYFAMMVARELKHLRPLNKDVLKLRIMEMIVEAKHSVVLEKCARVVQLTE